MTSGGHLVSPADLLPHRITNHVLFLSQTSASALRSRKRLCRSFLITAVVFRRLPARQASQNPILLLQSRNLARKRIFLLFPGLNCTSKIFVQFAQAALPVLVYLLCLDGLSA